MNAPTDSTDTQSISDLGGDYSRSDLIDGLKKVGIASGDVVFTVVGLATLGKVRGFSSSEELCESLLTALQEVVGTSGTILIPTYTFSFCRGELFDVQQTPSVKGPWSPSTDFLEYFRQLPGAFRSSDPIHSVSGLGPRAVEILSNPAPTCFGEDSFFQRLCRIGAKVCAIGLGLHESNLQHHVEETVGVPFRFKKLFTGYIRDNGVTEKRGWLYNVGILAKNGQVDEHRLEKSAREAGICRVARVGRGELLGVDSRDFFEFTSQALAKDPWFTAQGPAGDPIELERLRVGGPRYEVRLPQNASMEKMIEVIWRLPRDIVSEGRDAALAELATQVPMKIHEYPTGTECGSWIIPEKWTCHEAYLETIAGRRLFSYADCPLHVVSYSLPFDGVVSRQELLEHLHVHEKIPEAIPFIYDYEERAWGLCCSKLLQSNLKDDRYRVKIQTSFSYGTLKVGEVIAPGESENCYVLCAYLYHPAMLNDDLSGVVVGIKAMQTLLKRKNLHYTYRFLILPQTMGRIAYLEKNAQLVPKMKGGFFLEMLGLNFPHALQLSFDGQTELDRCLSLAVKSADPYSWTGACRTVLGNEERQFDGPGVRVPMLSLSRVSQPSIADSPYRQYHSRQVTPETASIENLERSCEVVLRMVDAIEGNKVSLNRF